MQEWSKKAAIGNPSMSGINFRTMRFLQRARLFLGKKRDSIWTRFWLSMRKVDVDRSCIFIGSPIVDRHDGSTISLESETLLISRSEGTALGVSHPVVIRTLAPEALIRICRGVGISGGSICAAKEVVIGENTLIGADSVICDTDFHGLRPSERRDSVAHVRSARPISIGENVFIGTRVIILKGVRVGKNSVIGAGSVVTTDIPENCIAAGNPCKIIRELGE